MEFVSAEELLIEEGKSDELVRNFNLVREATVDDGPKFTDKTCRELGRAIACRNYGRALHELVHLVVIAAACDRSGAGYFRFFWDSGPAIPRMFRGFVRSCEPLPRGFRVTPQGVAVTIDGETFLVSYGRMPFLSALMEFLMNALDYDQLGKTMAPLLVRPVSREAIGATTNALQRRLYEYLRDNLPSAHHQRKSHRLLAFLTARSPDSRIGPEDVDDDAILDFWIDQSAGDEETADFKTYQGAFSAAVELRRVLRFAIEKYRISTARSIGADREAGEVDPGDPDIDAFDSDEEADAVDALVGALDPLKALAEPPLEAVKFLNGRENETAAEIALGPGIAPALPRSVFRNAIFGRAQNRITNALRHGRLTDTLLVEAPEGDYPGRLDDYRALHERIERTLLAVLHVLAMDRRPEAIELALAIRPGLDLAHLAGAPDGEAEAGDRTVVSITAARAAERFFERAGARAGGGDPLAALMAEARKAFRANARQGFDEAGVEAEDVVDVFAESVTPLLALRREIVDFLASAGDRDWQPPFHEDREVFTRQFRVLYRG